MDLSVQCCPNSDCLDYGKVEAGNIGIHSRKEKWFVCRTCGKTFAATHGTPLYRRRLDHQLIAWMVSLLAHGCPPEAIMATFEVDPRTVQELWVPSGQHDQRIHEANIRAGRPDLGQVLMDELRHKIQGAVLWIAMTMALTTHLGLDATVSLQRDKALIVRLVEKVKAAALCRLLLLWFDGFSAYISACRQVFRTPVRTGNGRPRLVPRPDIHLGQVIKQYARRRVISVGRRIVRGSASLVASLLEATQKGGVEPFIHRAAHRDIPFPVSTPGAARPPSGRKESNVLATTYRVETACNFCPYHDALRVPLYRVYRRKVMGKMTCPASCVYRPQFT
ncbi:MAG: hypothetical protein QW707_09810 [Candidatus Bathyarchaeia archaeon]